MKRTLLLLVICAIVLSACASAGSVPQNESVISGQVLSVETAGNVDTAKITCMENCVETIDRYKPMYFDLPTETKVEIGKYYRFDAVRKNDNFHWKAKNVVEYQPLAPNPSK